MYDLIIVGGGPAGLSSALYAVRANLKVLVLEAKVLGGQIVNSVEVENYPGIKWISGVDLTNNMVDQLKDTTCEFKFEKVNRITEDLKVYTDKNVYEGKSIIVATGLDNKTLGLENEEKLIGSGISYCASCDGNFFKGKTVAVVGGGNTALEDTLYLANLAKKVYLIHRRDTFSGFPKYVDKIKQLDNVEILFNSTINRINGENNLESLDVIINNNEENIEVDGLFVAIGKKPSNDAFKDILNLDDYGYIKSSDGVHTNIDHIYVAGDTRVKDLRQLTTAVSDGAIAASTAIKEILSEEK